MIMFPVSITGTLYNCVGCMDVALFLLELELVDLTFLCLCFLFLCWWVLLFIFL